MLSLIFIMIQFWNLLAHRLSNGHCDLLIDDRAECGFTGITKVECEDRNCCWIPFSQEDLRNPPWCSFPASNACGYTMISSGILQDQCNISRTANISVQSIDGDILRVKITRSSREFVMPEWIYPEIKPTRLMKMNDSSESELNLKNFSDQNNNFNFKIMRKDTKEPLWDTYLNDPMSSSSFRMKSMYTQIGSELPFNHSIYGLGYHAGSLKVKTETRLALFSRDSPTLENQNLYSSHPFYIEMRKGKAHGVVKNELFSFRMVLFFFSI